MNFVLRRYCQAWRMWNSWLRACERPEVDIESFIDSGFVLCDTGVERGTILGKDNGYDVKIDDESIHISFNGKPRFSWYPYVTSYGNLDRTDEEAHYRLVFGDHEMAGDV